MKATHTIDGVDGGIRQPLKRRAYSTRGPQRICWFFLLWVWQWTGGPIALAQADRTNVQQIELRISKPPVWKDYCLQLSVERINRSNDPIFLPLSPEVLVYSSVTDDTNTLGQGKGAAWVPVHGQSDIISTDVMKLQAGGIRKSEYCIEDTFTVLNKEARRQVPLRGRLRVYARYYLEAPNWQISKQQAQEMAHTSPEKWKNANKWSGGWVKIEIPIPCRNGGHKSDCDVPPPIFAGESTLPVPPG